MKTVENRTISIVLNELNASVDAYNASTDAAERIKLAVDHKNLVQEHNELSMLNAYALFMKAERPLVELAKTYYYDTVNVKDTPHDEVVEGIRKITVTRSVQFGNKKFDVVKFIEWTAERNKSVAVNKDWKAKTEAARNFIIGEWKKFFATKYDTHSMSIGKTKKALQAMFDSLVFIPSESGKNAVIANGDIAKWVLGMANSRKDSKVDAKVIITGNILPKATWNTLLLDILHKAVLGKTFDLVFGDEGEEEAEAAPKTAKKNAAESTEASAE